MHCMTHTLCGDYISWQTMSMGVSGVIVFGLHANNVSVASITWQEQDPVRWDGDNDVHFGLNKHCNNSLRIIILLLLSQPVFDLTCKLCLISRE